MSGCEWWPLMQPQVIPNYVLPPGVCFLCRAPQRYPSGPDAPGERLVFTNVMADTPASVNYAQEPVVICEACITNMGHLVGMASTADVERANDARVAAEAALEQVKAEAADLRAALDALTRAGYGAAVAGATGEPETAEPEVEVVCEECGAGPFKNELGLASHVGRRHKEVADV